MSNSKFKINTTEKFDKLRNAPIVEAVIQLNAPPSKPFEESVLKEILSARFLDYKVQGQMQFEAGFESSVDGKFSMHHMAQWDGFRLNSDDAKHICQWKRNSLVFSRLEPYESWEKLLGGAMSFWAAYKELGAPNLVEGIGVRFISQIPLAEEEKFTDYIQKISPPLKGLGLRAESFFHQDTIPLKGYPYEIRLIRAVQPAAEKSGSKRVLIVDINVVTTRAVTFDQFEKALDEMRYIKNKVFFSYMKNANERFK